MPGLWPNDAAAREGAGEALAIALRAASRFADRKHNVERRCAVGFAERPRGPLSCFYPKRRRRL